ncbi:MAG: iron uptake porin [Cyanobacteria bacterium]|nr:iron uptake porin [Cyanobacteriota bacterium]
MNLFQKLLLAPAALGLMAPVAASAADMNLAGVNQYASTEEQVTSISQFSDVQPTDWAYQALSNLVERYGCVAGYPNGTFQGKKAMTRFEAAALLNACLDRVTEVTDQLKKLMKEFEKELAILKGRVDGLEARVGTLEANQFSTTTKLKGSTYWVLGANSFGGNFSTGNGGASATEGGTTFNYDLRLDLDTSFTGKDLLRTRLRAGNFGASGFNGSGLSGLNALEVSFEQSLGATTAANVVGIDRLFYQFPLGSGFTFTGGPRVRQDDMLAMWPSAYPADTILDVFTYAGAPGAYSLNLGGGAGIWWQKNGFSISANYVSSNANSGQPGYTGVATTSTNNPSAPLASGGGGVMTQGAASSSTVQLGYAGSNWGAAFAYTYSQNGASIYGGNATPLAVLASTNGTGTSNNYGLSAYWSPKTSGYIPSISAGWGYSSYDAANTAAGTVWNTANGLETSASGITAAQNWYVGLQWADAFVKGNSLGMAVGQPTFVTAMNSGTPQDAGYAWEWWYKFQVTDHISVTPAIFYLSNPTGQYGFSSAQADGLSTTNPLTNFGGLIKTTFKF